MFDRQTYTIDINNSDQVKFTIRAAAKKISDNREGYQIICMRLESNNIFSIYLLLNQKTTTIGMKKQGSKL